MQYGTACSSQQSQSQSQSRGNDRTEKHGPARYADDPTYLPTYLPSHAPLALPRPWTRRLLPYILGRYLGYTWFIVQASGEGGRPKWQTAPTNHTPIHANPKKWWGCGKSRPCMPPDPTPTLVFSSFFQSPAQCTSSMVVVVGSWIHHGCNRWASDGWTRAYIHRHGIAWRVSADESLIRAVRVALLLSLVIDEDGKEFLRWRRGEGWCVSWVGGTGR